MKPIDRRAALALLAGLPAAFAAGPAPISVPLSYDKDGRPTVPVGINGKGPFALVADTAAGGTALTPGLVQELGLAEDASQRVSVRGASGTASVQAYNLESLSVGSLEVRPARATSLPNGDISDSRGVLGAGTFASGRLEFDFAAGRLNAGPSHGAAPSGYTAVKAQVAHRILHIIPAKIGGIELPALIDSGARATLGNTKLMQALGFSENDARLIPESRPSGATGHVMRTWTGGRFTMEVAGDTTLAQSVIFAELPVFAPLGLDEGPSLLLGIDALRRFDAVAIDYPRAEVQFRPRA